MKRFYGQSLLVLSVLVGTSLYGQTLYAPGGTVSTSSTGNVGIGISSPQADLHLYSTGAYRPGLLLESVGDTAYPYLILEKARAGTTAVQNGDPLGTLLFQGYSSGAYRQSSYISAIADAAPSGSNVYSALTFVSNHPGGGGSYENMRITSAGYVGIGTASPNEKLHVTGAIQVSGGSVNFSNTTSTAMVDFAGGTARLLSFGSDGSTYGAIGFYAAKQNNGSGYYPMFIDTLGNVGIGTTNPQARLHVQKNGAVSTDYALSQLMVGGTDGNKRLALAYDTTNNIGLIQAYINGGAVQNLVLQSAGGNVGIGTTSPTHKLAVNGTVRAKEVIVDTGWSDYVFDDDYRLAPLDEVEAHIKAKKHLPGIPSATEVAERGVSIGEMQSKLLAKVEELTLHVIELKKENDALRQEMKTLNERLK